MPAIHPESAVEEAEKELSQSVWPQLESIYFQNFERVLNAFRSHRVGEEHFFSVTGYGHDDLGRAVTDRVFAEALQAESALVRTSIASGTHAIAIALNGCLRHGDTLMMMTGSPYDTLEEVIGIRGDDPQSLRNRGIRYLETSVIDGQEIRNTLTEQQIDGIRQARIVYFQRSCGYSIRPSLSVRQFSVLCRQVRIINPNAIIFVDNCYGEFTEAQEPTAVGADLIAGSLIKNPGGGIVPAGGYIAGRKDLVDACASVLTCPGVGRHGGYTFDLTRLILQGLFLAPHAVYEALKGMTLAAFLFEREGYASKPLWHELRTDIIQTLQLGDPEKLIGFCRTLQKFSPVNSAITPIPADVPGYADKVVMAGGTFIEGATLELSADGPLRAPFSVFLQGGLCYAHTRSVLKTILETI